MEDRNQTPSTVWICIHFPPEFARGLLDMESILYREGSKEMSVLETVGRKQKNQDVREQVWKVRLAISNTVNLREKKQLLNCESIFGWGIERPRI